MQKYIFEAELHREYQKPGYQHYGIKLIIVAHDKQSAFDKLGSYEVSRGRIHYYASDYQVIDLQAKEEIEAALKEEKESIRSFHENHCDIKALGLIIGLMGSCITETNICANPIKMDYERLKQIMMNKTIHNLLGIKILK